MTVHAIILAAGRGQRLGAAAAGRPKCLLEFGGSSLLERHLTQLHELGVAHITLVTGYRHEQVAAALSALGDRGQVERITNPEFTAGSVVSLHCAARQLQSGADILLMDADVLYEQALLARLLRARGNCFLLDRDFERGAEPVKLCVAGDTLVEFSKQPAADIRWDYQGESVGFFRFDAAVSRRLALQAQRYMEEGRSREPYENVIRDLLLAAPEQFGFEDITGLLWLEIDFPADAQRAVELEQRIRQRAISSCGTERK